MSVAASWPFVQSVLNVTEDPDARAPVRASHDSLAET